MNIIIQVVFSYLATVAFGLFINVPRNALNLAGLSGMLGWMTYWLIMKAGIDSIFANFTAGLVVGLLGLIFSQIKHMPVTIFNIPGLVPLVPGASAYQALTLLLDGRTVLGLDKLFDVVMISGAIAIGYVCSQLISEVYFHYRRYHRFVFKRTDKS